MRVRGQDNVWAIGDAAAVPDPAQSRKAPSPPTAQHAIRQGRVVGSNVAATLAGNRQRPFRYRTLGVFVDLGQHKAVATMLGVPLRGFPAWFAARTYHLAMMPGMARRVRLAADWTVGLAFGRASAELGQLGHPPSLQDYLDEVPQLGRGTRRMSEFTFREGRASDLQAVFELGEVAWDALRRARGLVSREHDRSEGGMARGLAARAPADRVPRCAGGRVLPRLRGRRRARGLCAHGALRLDGRDGGALDSMASRGGQRAKFSLSS